MVGEAVEAVKLGRRGPVVSRFCLGLLPLSRLQSNLPRGEAVRLVEEALEAGVTFFDTAELYETYWLVRQALGPPAVVATKAYAYTYGGMRDSLRRALDETGRERIDIFLLHEQESRLTLAGHAAALRCLVEAREAGVVGAVGVSTHAPEVVAAAAEMEEIDVVHPLVNHRGLGLLGGTLQDMLTALEKAGRAGKGIYAMKVLGGGHLGAAAEEAFAFVRSLEHVQAVAVGVKSREELLYDLALLRGERPSAELARAVAGRRRFLFIEEHCGGCGECVGACRHGALELVPAKGLLRTPAPGEGNGGPPERGPRLRVRVDMARCVLCGYCAAACRDFCIKVV